MKLKVDISTHATNRLVTPLPQASGITAWRNQAIAGLRIAFGLIWGVAALLKWQPAFQNSFLDQFPSSQGLLPVIAAWLSFWTHIISYNPLLFARLEASTETALAILLVLGLFSNLSYVVGILLSLGIWAVPEAFGGPYVPGQTTDVGAALPYALIFCTLLLLSAGSYYSLDRRFTPSLGRLGFLAAGPFRSRKTGR